MFELYVFLRGAVIGVLGAIVLLALLAAPRQGAYRSLVALALCVSAYTAVPLVHERIPGLFNVLVFFSDLAPVSFLFFSRAVFSDHDRGAALAWALVLLCAVVSVLDKVFPSPLVLPGVEMSELWLLERVLMSVALLWALVLVLGDWRNDVVEPRRRLRLVVCMSTGVYILVVILTEALAGDEAVALWIEVLHSALMLLSCAVFAAAYITLGPEALLQPASHQAPSGRVSERQAQDPHIVRLLQIMSEERRYRDMELSIRSLAASLALPEHRLRRLINRDLGYRNFNDFLNHYRLGEVSEQLRDPSHHEKPILSIAMDAGYRSMTTFNRVFRARFACTPSEYRDSS